MKKWASRKLTFAGCDIAPGVLEALSGVVHCKTLNVGMVVLVVGSPSCDVGQFQVPELDLPNLLRPVCKQVFKATTGSEITSCIVQAADLAKVGFEMIGFATWFKTSLKTETRRPKRRRATCTGVNIFYRFG